MKVLKGTTQLIRLAFRRDRIKLSIWIIAIAGLLIASASSVIALYKTEESRIGYAMTSAVSAVARAFNGPITGPDLGNIVSAETFTFSTIFIALMSIFAVTRHTRQNEETGRAELIMATVVGRHAMLTSALILTILANVLIGICIAVGFIAFDLDIESSIIYAASFASVGIIFAGIAALTAQLGETTRGANGMALGALAFAFITRAIGDMQGKVLPSGLEAESGWVSWLSPIGWAQRVRPFDDNSLWPFLFLGLFFAFLIALSFYIATKRDVGTGIFEVRTGPKVAAKRLLSPVGLAWRLQKGVVIGWSIAIIILGISLGAVANEVNSIMEMNKEAAELIKQIGGSDSLVDAYLGFAMNIFGVLAAGYLIQSLLRMRNEEADGRLEPILATKVSRLHFALSHIVIAAFGCLLLLVLAGICTGLPYGIISDNVSHYVWQLTKSALVQIPVVFIFGGIVIAAFGLFSRVSFVLSWSIFGVLYMIMQFGQLLKLPKWIMDLSPFAHIPNVEDIKIFPILIMLGITLVLSLVGLVGFKRRDLTTE